jgi:type I restriction enzyme S subunit
MSSTFQNVPMGEVATFKTGKLDSNAAVENGAYPFFTCSRDTFRTNTYSFDDEVVLLAGNNANGIYPLKYFKGKFDAYQRTYVIRPIDETRLNTRFLYFALRPQLDHLRSVSTGSATKFLTMGLLSNLELPLPDLPTQRKIAGILSAYDDLIENNLRRIKILEQMAQSLYREWFVHFRFPGHESATFKDSELGRIPEGWKRATLGSLCKAVREKFDESKHSGLPLLDLSRMPSQTLAPSEFGSSGDLGTSRILFKAGDTLFGTIRPYLHKVCRAPFGGITNVSVFVLRAHDNRWSALVSIICSSIDSIEWAVQHSTGLKMPVIKWDQLTKFPISLAPEPLLIRFDSITAPIMDEISNLSRRNLVLRRTRDLLLTKLLNPSDA